MGRVKCAVSTSRNSDGFTVEVRTKDGRFQNLDRRLRQELLALDGAMVLDHLGNIVAAGAIVSVPAGSEGGGRTAAAKNGSSLGLGIKISEDGGISVYKEGNKIFVA